jgi:hypothetical protein
VALTRPEGSRGHDAPVLGAAVGRALAVAPAAPGWVVAGTAALAAALVVGRRSWRVLAHVSTIVHEGAHAVAALLVRRRLRGVRLHSDASGVALSHGRPRGPGMVATAAAGYLGPALLGVGAAALLAAGRPAAVLWSVLVALALLLVQLRTWFGLGSVLATAGVLAAVTGWAPPPAQSAAAHLLVWFLPLAGLRDVRGLARARSRGVRTSDADQLARLTGVPAPAWVALFALVSLAALALVAWWSLEPPAWSPPPARPTPSAGGG